MLLPGKLNGQRSLVGYSLWGHKESDMTELVPDIKCFKLLVGNSLVVQCKRVRGEKSVTEDCTFSDHHNSKGKEIFPLGL